MAKRCRISLTVSGMKTIGGGQAGVEVAALLVGQLRCLAPAEPCAPSPSFAPTTIKCCVLPGEPSFVGNVEGSPRRACGPMSDRVRTSRQTPLSGEFVRISARRAEPLHPKPCNDPGERQSRKD